MELTMANAINAAARSERELTADELEHVSGGSPSHGGAPVRYMEFKLKEVFITSVH
jgi:bacteriocin-like protein